MRPVRLPAIAAALLLAAGCGGTSAGSSSTRDAIRVLSASAVPGIPFTTAALTVTELSKDAAIPGLSSKFTSWGYVQGAQRTFQGESRHLTYVVSRALVFKDVSGASAYVDFVHTNATAYFGIAGVQSLDAQGRPGWQFTPAACACHMANPVVIGVVSSQSVVAWLEINGPDATPALLLGLLDPANSV
jgi:hypothetical protein